MSTNVIGRIIIWIVVLALVLGGLYFMLRKLGVGI